MSMSLRAICPMPFRIGYFHFRKTRRRRVRLEVETQPNAFQLGASVIRERFLLKLTLMGRTQSNKAVLPCLFVSDRVRQVSGIAAPDADVAGCRNRSSRPALVAVDGCRAVLNL
jgi:hypothetical protein